MPSDLLNTLLAEASQPCPSCGHLLTSAPDRRCVECGAALRATIAVSEPSAGVVPFLLVSAGLSGGLGIERWVVYLPRLTDLSANLAASRWHWLAIEAMVLTAPIVAVIVVLRRRAIARQPRRRAMVLTAVLLLPFLVNLFLLLVGGFL